MFREIPALISIPGQFGKPLTSRKNAGDETMFTESSTRNENVAPNGVKKKSTQSQDYAVRITSASQLTHVFRAIFPAYTLAGNKFCSETE